MNKNVFVISEIKISYNPKLKNSERPKITTSKEAEVIFRSFFENIDYTESMYAMFLNHGNKVLGIKMISSGGTAGTVCDPKNVLQVALKAHASSFILAHNHPSGTMVASQADQALTTKIASAAKFHDMNLLDHLILSSEDYYSFADNGLIT
ncbi:MAG: JAB domain-containing protein [Lentimicrobium sp.]|nr:JAB domain-containing protein [Lentimicrobium sp.]